jgi:hypothetical protein
MLPPTTTATPATPPTTTATPAPPPTATAPPRRSLHEGPPPRHRGQAGGVSLAQNDASRRKVSGGHSSRVVDR